MTDAAANSLKIRTLPVDEMSHHPDHSGLSIVDPPGPSVASPHITFGGTPAESWHPYNPRPAAHRIPFPGAGAGRHPPQESVPRVVAAHTLDDPLGGPPGQSPL